MQDESQNLINAESQSNDEILRLKSRIHALKTELDAIEKSFAWRLTEPLRKLSEFARKAVMRYPGGLQLITRLVIRYRLSMFYNGKSGGAIHQLKVIKANQKEALHEELKDFLKSDAALNFAATEHPKVSVVLILFNQAPLTLRCLKSLSKETIPLELISTSIHSIVRSPPVLDRISGAKILKKDINVCFL